MTAIAALARSTLATKTVRYALVSVIAVVVSQAVLVGLVAGAKWPGVAANLVAVSIGCVPSYLLNRAWTWGKRGRNRLFGEVLPFWAMAVLGLFLSTWAVAIADSRWGTPLAVSAANLAAFGVLWVAKFAVLNRVLFRVADVAPDDELTDAAA